VIVANLRAVPVRCLVARSGVVDRDPGRRFQPGAQHLARFVEETPLASNQQPHDLPLGNLDTDGLEQCHQPGHGDLALVILRQDEPAQLRPEVAVDPSRQRRHDPTTIGGHPALAAEPNGDRPQHQILDKETLIALKARSRRHCDAQHPVLDHDTRDPLAAATPALATTGRRLRLARLLHTARLDRRRALEPLQPRDLGTLFGNHLPQRRNLTQ